MRVLSALESLPLELLLEIIKHLIQPAALSLSAVNHGLRERSVAAAFKCITVDFSVDGLNSLREIIESPVAKHIRTLKYFVVPVLKTGMSYAPLASGLANRCRWPSSQIPGTVLGRAVREGRARRLLEGEKRALDV